MTAENNLSEESAFLNLLNGISKRQFFGDTDITEKTLKAECFPLLSDEEFHLMHEKTCQILKTIASSSMDLSQLQAFLTSRMKHRDAAHRITDQQARIISKFWKNQKADILETLSSRTRFNPTLKNFNWRLDIVSQGNNEMLQQKNKPIVVFQLNLENTSLNSNVAKRSVIEMELDGKGFSKLFTCMKEIDNQIKHFVQTPLTNI